MTKYTVLLYYNIPCIIEIIPLTAFEVNAHCAHTENYVKLQNREDRDFKEYFEISYSLYF